MDNFATMDVSGGLDDLVHVEPNFGFCKSLAPFEQLVQSLSQGEVHYWSTTRAGYKRCHDLQRNVQT